MSEHLWAKKKLASDGTMQWLPLHQHLKDTADIMGYLYEHWLSESQRQLIKNSINNDSTDCKSLCKFLGFVHDIGKATPAFQTKSNFSSRDLDLALLEKLEKDGFTGISTLNLNNPDKSPHTIAGATILNYALENGKYDDICLIVSAHHGKPIDNIKSYKENRGNNFNNYNQYGRNAKDNEKLVVAKWEKSQKDILNLAFEHSGILNKDDLPTEIKQPAQVILSGLLIMADWIASNEEYFPLFNLLEKDINIPKNRSEHAFIKWRKTSQWAASAVGDINERFKGVFGFSANNMQENLVKAIQQSKNPGIFILEAPMGLGKTEAALVGAEELAYKTNKSGVFFGLPTQATSNGIFPRLLNWVKFLNKEFVEDGFEESFSIRLVHGKAQLNEDFKSLNNSPASNVNIDESKGTVIINEWFNGRKTSALDEFVVGTIDQLLMLALKQKHLALRHLGFSKKVVVVDEVHSYDPYMQQYLFKALSWLGVYQVPVIILSATLSNKLRNNLIKAYNENADLTIDVKNEAYPSIIYTDGNEVKQLTDFEKLENKEVYVENINEEQLHELIKSITSEGGILGIIVNTVKKAQFLANLIAKNYGQDTVMLLHSAFVDTDRVKKEQQLLKMIGKNAKRPFSKVIIGTQVIEQSLDIDFDCLVTDMAPMDLLLQRLGRLHRHKIKRHKNYKVPKLYILGNDNEWEFESGTEAVYKKHILINTQEALPNKLLIPDDISKLVKRVYDGEYIFDDANKTKIYDNHKTDYKAYIRKFEHDVLSSILDEPYCNSESIEGWIDIKDSPNIESRVRNIEDTIEVIALKKFADGYTTFGGSENLANKIGNFRVDKEIAKNTIRLPKLLSKDYNIDKTINFLEGIRNKFLINWDNSNWLKSELAIIFDENNEFVFDSDKLNKKIKYSSTYGLVVEGSDIFDEI